MALHIVPICADVRIVYLGDRVSVEERGPEGWATDLAWDRMEDDHASEKACARARELRDAYIH